MSSILITGGAGFFGKAFARRLVESAPEDGGHDRICIYSRNEWNQAQMRAELNDDPRLRFFIGDVRDSDRLRRAMEGVDMVVHAAALKRVEVCEYNLFEAVGTNVLGTENVVNAAIDAGVMKAVLLSTDKACEPTTNYGLTKAVAERIFIGANEYAGPARTKFIVCRYGNVWKSTGSVVAVWRRLINDGETEVPMTDEGATRFYMTAEQAVDLVVKAINDGKPGTILTPDLPAYELATLARAMGATGWRPLRMGQGEKKHERMRADGPTSADVRRMSFDELQEALREGT